MDKERLQQAFKRGGYTELNKELDKMSNTSFSTAEIAEILGMKKDKVKTILRSAFVKLKNKELSDQLEPYLYD
jgi:DNA-directed RNA polymerase specialized sigma24 family protein